jgi:hypothetical protein
MSWPGDGAHGVENFEHAVAVLAADVVDQERVTHRFSTAAT